MAKSKPRKMKGMVVRGRKAISMEQVAKDQRKTKSVHRSPQKYIDVAEGMKKKRYRF